MSKLLKSELQLNSQAVTLESDKALCIICHQEVDRVFTNTGKYWLGTQFISSKPTGLTELTYDDSGNLVDEQTTIDNEEPPKRPIDKWAKGTICNKCSSSDYRTVTKYRQVWTMVKGKPTQIWEEYFVPRIQLDPVKVMVRNKVGKMVSKPTYSVSMDPGWSRHDQRNDDLEYSPHSELWQPPKPTRSLDEQVYPLTIPKPRNGFEQVKLREKLDDAKSILRARKALKR